MNKSLFHCQEYFLQCGVENKQLKEENEKLNANENEKREMTNENKQF